MSRKSLEGPWSFKWTPIVENQTSVVGEFPQLPQTDAVQTELFPEKAVGGTYPLSRRNLGHYHVTRRRGAEPSQ
jgi:hypothetical protein